jgi:hypothetical protein
VPPLLFALTLVLALLAAPATGLAALDLDSLLKESSFSDSQKEQIRSIFTRADEGRIPRDLLLPRLAEGTAKRVGLPRLVEVIDGYVHYLVKARASLETLPGGKELLADPASWSLTATLLEAGTSEQEIRAMGTASGGEPGRYRSGELLHASLVSWGASRPVSLQVTLAVIGSVLPPDQYPGLIGLFEQGRQKHISPQRLAERIIDSLPGVKTIDDLRRAVLY